MATAFFLHFFLDPLADVYNGMDDMKYDYQSIEKKIPQGAFLNADVSMN